MVDSASPTKEEMKKGAKSTVRKRGLSRSLFRAAVIVIIRVASRCNAIVVFGISISLSFFLSILSHYGERDMIVSRCNITNDDRIVATLKSFIIHRQCVIAITLLENNGNLYLYVINFLFEIIKIVR